MNNRVDLPLPRLLSPSRFWLWPNNIVHWLTQSNRQLLVNCRQRVSYLVLHCLFASSTMAAPGINGIASFEHLGKERFLAALYSDVSAENTDSLFTHQQDRRLEIRATNNFSARQHVKSWIQGAAINNPSAVLKDYANAMVSFTRLINTPLQVGDQLVIDAPLDQPVVVSLNGVRLGEITPPGIFDVLLRAWIGNVPPSSAFRQNLLAAGRSDDALRGRFDGLNPAQDRIEFANTYAIGLTQLPEASIPTDPAANEATVPAVTTAVATPSERNVAAPTDPVATISADTSPVIDPPTLDTPLPEVNSPTSAVNEQTAAVEPETIALTESAAPSLDSEPTVTDQESLPETDSAEPALTAETLLQQQLYHSELLKKVFQKVKYPSRAVERDYEGRVTLQVAIDQRGRLKQIDTIALSEHQILNRAAQRAVKAAAPFPSPTGLLEEGEDYVFTVPIEFVLQ